MCVSVKKNEMFMKNVHGKSISNNSRSFNSNNNDIALLLLVTNHDHRHPPSSSHHLGFNLTQFYRKLRLPTFTLSEWREWQMLLIFTAQFT